MLNFILVLLVLLLVVYSIQIYRLCKLLSAVAGVKVYFSKMFFNKIFSFQTWQVISNKDHRTIVSNRRILENELRAVFGKYKDR